MMINVCKVLKKFLEEWMVSVYKDHLNVSEKDGCMMVEMFTWIVGGICKLQVLSVHTDVNHKTVFSCFFSEKKMNQPKCSQKQDSLPSIPGSNPMTLKMSVI